MAKMVAEKAATASTIPPMSLEHASHTNPRLIVYPSRQIAQTTSNEGNDPRIGWGEGRWMYNLFHVIVEVIRLLLGITHIFRKKQTRNQKAVFNIILK